MSAVTITSSWSVVGSGVIVDRVGPLGGLLTSSSEHAVNTLAPKVRMATKAAIERAHNELARFVERELARQDVNTHFISCFMILIFLSYTQNYHCHRLLILTSKVLKMNDACKTEIAANEDFALAVTFFALDVSRPASRSANSRILNIGNRR
jgi:hypothetical protein